VETRIPPLEGDVAAMFSALEAQPNVDPARMAILGAESGADIALTGCAEDARCLGAGLLTPLDQNALLPDMSAFGGRSLWMAVSEEDSTSALTAEALRQAATGPATLQTYQEAGRGTQMLFSQPQVSASLVDWLRGLLGV
jgi:dienelactone hydrolase